MKKTAGILVLSILLFSFSYAKWQGYVTLFDNANSGKYYVYGKSHYFEYFDNEKQIIGDKEYYIKYRRYGWGKIDTTYYRKGTYNYYHIDKNTHIESIVLPINPKLGDRWKESDESWSYEVIADDQKFKTPGKKYKNCVKVHCKQLTNRDSKKSKSYFLFYSPEFGYVGNVDSNGKVLSYLKEVKLNAKEGDKIGGN